MRYEIRDFPGKRLTGIRMQMSFADDRTSQLWREFRLHEADAEDRIGNESYSVKIFASNHSFEVFDPVAEFEVWAALEAVGIPEGWETLEVTHGEYAVFVHKGPASQGAHTFQYIFGEWLPKSAFVVDDRPHFEVLPAGYDPFDAEATEEVWIPVRER